LNNSFILYNLKSFDLDNKRLVFKNEEWEIIVPLDKITSFSIGESTYPFNRTKYIGLFLISLGLLILASIIFVFPSIIGLVVSEIVGGFAGILMYILTSVLSIILIFVGADLFISFDNLKRKRVRAYKLVGIAFLILVIASFPLLVYPYYSGFEIILLASFLALSKLRYGLILIIYTQMGDFILVGDKTILRELYDKLQKVL